MNFRSVGQTKVDQSLCIVYETFTLVQMVFSGHIVMYHQTIDEALAPDMWVQVWWAPYVSGLV